MAENKNELVNEIEIENNEENKTEAKTENKNENRMISLESVISTAIKIPGVKINRGDFLRDKFKNETREMLEKIIDVGPVEAGCDRNLLMKIAKGIINGTSWTSAGASALAGIPGGLAMAATVPADLAQFYGMALRMAQEISYLYGAADLWDNGNLDMERVQNQLILYCGVMLGAAGAVQTVRMVCAALAKKALTQLPKKALTKTLIYSIVKAISKALGLKMTKTVFAKGVSKVIPFIGGVVSGGMTLASMYPMGMRLAEAFDKAYFDYTVEDFNKDYEDVMEVVGEEITEEEEVVSEDPVVKTDSSTDKNNALEKIAKAKEMLDAGIITEEEFSQIKARLISEL